MDEVATTEIDTAIAALKAVTGKDWPIRLVPSLRAELEWQLKRLRVRRSSGFDTLRGSSYAKESLWAG